jgi:hypothetical protein
MITYYFTAVGCTSRTAKALLITCDVAAAAIVIIGVAGLALQL